MATKDQTLSNAQHCKARTGKSVFVYRVSSAWMYTTESFEMTQAKYKKTIMDWMEIV